MEIMEIKMKLLTYLTYQREIASSHLNFKK
jgi:hypothetical protein